MWSYVAYDAERETRLAERARTRHLVPRRSLRERLDATRSLLSRRERKVLERHSVVLLVPEGGELHAPSPLGTRQFLLLEQGCAGVVVDGGPARALDPGDVVAHAPGTSIRAASDLRVRVLTPQEHDVVRRIPALRERLVEAA